MISLLSIVEAPKQRLTAAEKATIKGGGTPTWPQAKARQKDTEARWPIKRGRAELDLLKARLIGAD